MFRKLRITKVDMFGFNGRDFHPEPSDEGLVVTVLRSEVWVCEEGATDFAALDLLGDANPDDIIRLQGALAHPADAAYCYEYFEVLTQDGRRLTLLDFETEEVPNV